MIPKQQSAMLIKVSTEQTPLLIITGKGGKNKATMTRTQSEQQIGGQHIMGRGVEGKKGRGNNLGAARARCDGEKLQTARKAGGGPVYIGGIAFITT